MIRRVMIAAFGLLALPGCQISDESAGAEKSAPNVLLMIADDMGVETLSCYGVGREFAETPNLDRLCAEGVKFTQFWSQPSCSPTRAALMTGRHGFRTGSLTPTGPMPTMSDVEGKPKQITDGMVITAAARSGQYNPPEDAPFRIVQQTGKVPPGLKLGESLPDDELTLPQAIRQFGHANYALGAIGKWHLTNPYPGWLGHPQSVGFDHYVGGLAGAINNYYSHDRVENGVEIGSSDAYATTQQVDDALAWINGREADQPWFLWLAFNAPHDGFHKPPNELISERYQELDPQGITPANVVAYYRAMIEALDHEIGRLLAAIEPEELANTYVVFMGDNGTSQNVITAPFVREQGKGSLYRGGVNVPLFISGPGIDGSRAIDSQVNVVDLFATILDWSGADWEQARDDRTIDALSFADVLSGAQDAHSREFNFADVKGWLPTGYYDQRAISDGRYKLIVDYKNDKRELYDVVADPFERADLLASDPEASDLAIADRLEAQIDTLTKQ